MTTVIKYMRLRTNGKFSASLVTRRHQGQLEWCLQPGIVDYQYGWASPYTCRIWGKL